ncbi:MAG: ATP synthase protein I [Nitrosospira sp.]
MRWQSIVTAAMVMVLGFVWGLHGAASAFLGGVTSIASAAVFAVIIARYPASTPAGVLITAFKAEAMKVIFIVLMLWLVLTLYKDVVAVGFIGTFAITVLIFGMALFVTDDAEAIESRRQTG